MNIKGAIFDLDGTLLDSMPLWNTRATDYLVSRGIMPEPDVDKTYKALSLVQAAEYFREHYGFTESVEEISHQLNQGVEKGYFETIKPKDGVPEFLEFLRGRGIPMCIATATERYLVEAVLTRLGLLDYFKGILTCGEVGHGKDEPEIFLRAAKLLGTGVSDTAVFEDAPHAIKTARSAGFFIAAVADDSYTEERENIRAMSDIFITSYKDLIKFLS